MSGVSNTSPLRYLIAVGRVDLLPGLFDEILIPFGVADELSKGDPELMAVLIAANAQPIS